MEAANPLTESIHRLIQTVRVLTVLSLYVRHTLNFKSTVLREGKIRNDYFNKFTCTAVPCVQAIPVRLLKIIKRIVIILTKNKRILRNMPSIDY